MRELVDHPATKRIATAAVAVVLFAGTVAAATKSDDGDVGEGRLSTRGRAAITAINGQRREVSGVVGLHTGETVDALDGTMSIELPDGSTVEGRAAHDRVDGTRVKILRPVELLGGELLVVAKDGTEVMAAGNRVHLDEGAGGANAMRVSRSLSVGASVYRGTASFDSAGQVRALTALRALQVSALGHPPATPTPLHVDEGDPWDRRFLSDAIDLGHTLDGYAYAYSRTLGTANASSPAYYRTLLPSLSNEPEFTADLLSASSHSAGDTIVGGAIAGLSRRGAFTKRWEDVFAFKDAGAGWGLVALDQGVASGPLLAEVQNAVNTTQFGFALGAATTTTPTGATGTTTPSPSTTRPGGGGGPTTTNPPPPPTTVAPVPPTGSPVVDGVVNDVNQLLGGIVGQPPKH